MRAPDKLFPFFSSFPGLFHYRLLARDCLRCLYHPRHRESPSTAVANLKHYECNKTRTCLTCCHLSYNHTTYPNQPLCGKSSCIGTDIRATQLPPTIAQGDSSTSQGSGCWEAACCFAPGIPNVLCGHLIITLAFSRFAAKLIEGVLDFKTMIDK